ncbi:hypothetical protein [Cohnella sp. 56]|uniref:hypothetical protein n=1 Tax=Cohnella sp. 56 TaxID=3113722 RepID=UPI0030E94EF5
MTIGSQSDIDVLKEIGKIVAMTIRAMKRNSRVGITTKELDEIGGQLLNEIGRIIEMEAKKGGYHVIITIEPFYLRMQNMWTNKRMDKRCVCRTIALWHI